MDLMMDFAPFSDVYRIEYRSPSNEGGILLYDESGINPQYIQQSGGWTEIPIELAELAEPAIRALVEGEQYDGTALITFGGAQHTFTLRRHVADHDALKTWVRGPLRTAIERIEMIATNAIQLELGKALVSLKIDDPKTAGHVRRSLERATRSLSSRAARLGNIEEWDQLRELAKDLER